MNHKITPEDLKEVEDFAYGLMSAEEICIIKGWSFEDIGHQFNHSAYKLYHAFQKGSLRLKYELNMDNIKFAKQGNAHAMNKVLELYKEIQLLELKLKNQR